MLLGSLYIRANDVKSSHMESNVKTLGHLTLFKHVRSSFENCSIAIQSGSNNPRQPLDIANCVQPENDT